jgi:Cytidylyltransferase-like
MQIFEMFEGAGKRVVVTYPGRFQPFHLGHKDVFNSLQSQFGSDNVYIVSSDKVEPPKSPFSFSDKVQFMRAAGIPAHSIIHSAKVYDLPEQFAADKSNIIFVTAVGAPEAKRLGTGGQKKDGSPAYFQPWKGDLGDAQTADKHGYVIVEPEHSKTITVGGTKVDVSHGTPVRALWEKIKGNEKLRKEFIMQMYGQYHADLEPILDKIAESVDLNEVSLGNYYTKANKSRIDNIAKTIFADPANPEVIAAKRALVNRERGIQRMSARNQKTYQAQQQQQQQDQLAQDTANIDQLEAKLAELERQFDKNYEYSDDHRVWTKHNAIRQNIDALKKRIANARIGLDEDAAGVGVVKNGKDSRYMTATMGDDNIVTADTLPQMMKNYNLIPGKKKTIENKQDLRLHYKRNRFKGLEQRKQQEEYLLKRAMDSIVDELDLDPTDNTDDAVQQYLDRGGKIELLPYKKPRAKDKMNWGSKHIGTLGGTGKPAKMSGRGANVGKIGKPVVAVEEFNEPNEVESAIIRRIMMQHRDVLAQHGPEAVMRAAQEVADYVGDVDEIGTSDVSIWTKQAIRNLDREMYEGMFEYDREDPFNSEFAPSVGMGRMTLRSWKQSLAQRLKELSDYAQEATQAGNIDQAAMWENIHKKMKNLNLDPIAQEIELAHKELENIRRQGGVRSRAFQLKEMEVDSLEENWKKKLAALGLAGAIGMGAAGPAHADGIDKFFEPVQKINKVMRDVDNWKRQTDVDIGKVTDKVGRNIEDIPIPGISKIGSQMRGNVPPPLVDTSPEAADNARRNAEMNAEIERERAARRAEHEREMRQVPRQPGINSPW